MCVFCVGQRMRVGGAGAECVAFKKGGKTRVSCSRPAWPPMHQLLKTHRIFREKEIGKHVFS